MNGAKGGTPLHYSKGAPESCADSKNPVVKHSEGKKEGAHCLFQSLGDSSSWNG
jgi:hypothetical protein